VQHHDTRITGHTGQWKTLEFILVVSDVVIYWNVPTHPWQTVSVDFIMELPQAHSFNVIMVTVDTLGKRTHFLLMHTMITAVGAAQLCLHHVWKLHGLPDNMVSDRGLQFIVEFMHELY
jgi:hypothetical protein